MDDRDGGEVHDVVVRCDADVHCDVADRCDAHAQCDEHGHCDGGLGGEEHLDGVNALDDGDGPCDASAQHGERAQDYVSGLRDVGDQCDVHVQGIMAIYCVC